MANNAIKLIKQYVPDQADSIKERIYSYINQPLYKQYYDNGVILPEDKRVQIKDINEKVLYS